MAGFRTAASFSGFKNDYGQYVIKKVFEKGTESKILIKKMRQTL